MRRARFLAILTALAVTLAVMGGSARTPALAAARCAAPEGPLPGVRPGTAEVFFYSNCKGDRLMADVLRLDKGHTEGLEPAVTEQLVRMMVNAPGEKGRKG